MKLHCSTQIIDQRSAFLGQNMKRRYKLSSLVIMRNHDCECIMFHVTSQSTSRYKIKCNVKKMLTQFIKNGQATIMFKEPPHDILIQAEPLELQEFLVVVKKILQERYLNRPIPETTEHNMKSILKVEVPVKTKLEIKSKTEYPYIEGFPATLVHLRVNNVCPVKLDRRILQLKNLKVLHLEDNELKSLPKELGDLKLTSLSLANNALSESWEWLQGQIKDSLEALNLSHNGIKYLPKEMNELFKLKELDLSFNSLEKIHPRMGMLPQLKNLSISCNRLRYFPASFTLRNLSTLIIGSSFQRYDEEVERIFNTTNLMSETGPLPLLELAARTVLHHRVFYTDGDIPKTLIDHIDNVQHCKCGKPCITPYKKTIAYSHFRTEFLAAYVVHDSINDYQIPVLFSYCSRTCFEKYSN